MSIDGPLRLGTRRSRLAVTQSTWVADRLRALGHDVELVTIVTEGDVNAAPLTQIGGTGVFASALRAALTAGEVDLAVHSLKDLPVLPHPGLVVAAIPEREDVRDALVSAGGAGLDALPPGARIGTGAPRRAAQLACLRPDLDCVPIRGNVDSRLRRVHSGELDAVVLAAAGLSRLGLSGEITEVIDEQRLLPAPGQGALAVECRSGDERVLAAVAALDHPPTRAAVTAERALLRALEAGCTAPVGALARQVDDDHLALTAFVGTDDASLVFRDRQIGPTSGPQGLGEAVAATLLRAGAAGVAVDVAARRLAVADPLGVGSGPATAAVQPKDMESPT